MHHIVKANVFYEFSIKLLLKYNANVEIKNANGDTTYDIAVRKNLSEYVLDDLKPRSTK